MNWIDLDYASWCAQPPPRILPAPPGRSAIPKPSHTPSRQGLLLSPLLKPQMPFPPHTRTTNPLAPANTEHKKTVDTTTWRPSIRGQIYKDSIPPSVYFVPRLFPFSAGHVGTQKAPIHLPSVFSRKAGQIAATAAATQNTERRGGPRTCARCEIRPSTRPPITKVIFKRFFFHVDMCVARYSYQEKNNNRIVIPKRPHSLQTNRLLRIRSCLLCRSFPPPPLRGRHRSPTPSRIHRL